LAFQTEQGSVARSQILHLSDLHLGPVAPAQRLSHIRVSIPGEGLAQRDVIKGTLESLAASGELARMQAVVISGDLTNQAEGDGYQFFGQLAVILLEHLAADRVLVVPGNHDVDKEHQPGDPDRYAAFLKETRKRGFATPLLDGIDFTEDGTLTDEAGKYPHIVGGESFVIVPVNSSHFCWVTEPATSSLLEGLPTVPTDVVDEATKELRTHDMPRVSNAQMVALRRLLEREGTIPRTSLRLATLHHQLLPVDAREEVKGFEGLTNLGAVREFLADIDIDIVMHGHKHAAALYWDRVALSSRLEDPPHTMLVSAAPANFEPGKPVGRLLRLGRSPLAPEVDIEEIRAGTPFGSELTRTPLALARIWRPEAVEGEGAEVISGADFDTVYARLQSRFERLPADAALRYLICEISRPGELHHAPAGYPEPHDGWFSDLVEWWQFPEPHFDAEVSFNHGDRIHRRWGDQTAAAALLLSNAIPSDIATTRASILLIDPQIEASPAGDGEFPSFVSIQLQLAERGGALELDCTGSFRKQEMRYWWPINVAELGRVRDDVLHRLKANGREVQGGKIRTIAAYAIARGAIPVVAHAAVDRAVDREQVQLWRLAYGLMEPGRVADPAELRARWDHYLEDLRPHEDGSPPARSRRGLEAVLSFARVGSGDGDAAAVREALEDLVEFYGTADFKPPDPEALLVALRQRLDALEEALDDQYGPPGAS
jgi:predicted phosphodiesterase